MNISLCYCHTGAIELSLGSLLNTANQVEVARVGSWNIVGEVQLTGSPIKCRNGRGGGGGGGGIV